MLQAPAQAEFEDFWRAFEAMYLTIFLSALPTVVALNGAAPAGGTLLALVCDYRMVADLPKLSLGLNETQVGIVPPPWVRALAERTLGTRQAELCLQNAVMCAPAEALALGYVDEIVAPEALLDAAVAKAGAMASIPPQARAATKAAQREAVVPLFGEASVAGMWACVESVEFQEQAQAILARLAQRQKKKT